MLAEAAGSRAPSPRRPCPRPAVPSGARETIAMSMIAMTQNDSCRDRGEEIEDGELVFQRLFFHVCCSFMNRSPGTWQWDDVRFFLAVARTGSLSAAARALGVGHVTVGRRIALFEA